MSETVHKSYFRAFMCAPNGVKLAVVLLCFVSVSEIWNAIEDPVKIPIRLAAACFYLGLCLGLVKQKNWARIVVVLLVGLTTLVGVLNAVGTDTNDIPIFSIALILFIPILLLVVPLFLPRSNKWFRKQDISKEGGST